MRDQLTPVLPENGHDSGGAHWLGLSHPRLFKY